MVISALTRIGEAKSSTGVTTRSIEVGGGGVPAGALLIVRLSYRQTAGTPTCVDDRGNTYTIDRDSGSSARGVIFSAPVVTPLVAGDTIDATIASSEVAMDAHYVTGADTSGTRVAAANSATGSSTTPSVGTTPTAAGQLLIGTLARTGNAADDTNDADTTDGSWVAMTEVDPGAFFSTNAILNGQYKLVTGISAQTYNPTLSASRNWGVCLVAYKEAPDSGILLPILNYHGG